MNPLALAATRPQHLASLATVWAEMHPGVWQSCGYGAMFPNGQTAVVVGKV